MKSGHPLRGIDVSISHRKRLICSSPDRGPMAAAVDLRGKLGDLGYSVLIMSPQHFKIAAPDSPRRFVGYNFDQATRLLEKLYE